MSITVFIILSLHPPVVAVVVRGVGVDDEEGLLLSLLVLLGGVGGVVDVDVLLAFRFVIAVAVAIVVGLGGGLVDEEGRGGKDRGRRLPPRLGLGREVAGGEGTAPFLDGRGSLGRKEGKTIGCHLEGLKGGVGRSCRGVHGLETHLPRREHLVRGAIAHADREDGAVADGGVLARWTRVMLQHRDARHVLGRQQETEGEHAIAVVKEDKGVGASRDRDEFEVKEERDIGLARHLDPRLLLYQELVCR